MSTWKITVIILFSPLLQVFEIFYNKTLRRNFMYLKNRLLLKIIPKKKSCSFLSCLYENFTFYCKRLRTYISCSSSQFLPFLFIPRKSKLSFCFPDILQSLCLLCHSKEFLFFSITSSLKRTVPQQSFVQFKKKILKAFTLQVRKKKKKHTKHR